MSDSIIWTGLAVFTVAFIYWGLIRPAQLAQVHVSCNDGAITKTSGGKGTSINMADISEVNYHYSAVAGFVFIWELIDKKGGSFKIADDAKGIDDVPPFFESTLPGFSVKDFQKKFDAGDVEDTIDVWKRS